MNLMLYHAVPIMFFGLWSGLVVETVHHHDNDPSSNPSQHRSLIMSVS